MDPGGGDCAHARRDVWVKSPRGPHAWRCDDVCGKRDPPPFQEEVLHCTGGHLASFDGVALDLTALR